MWIQSKKQMQSQNDLAQTCWDRDELGQTKQSTPNEKVQLLWKGFIRLTIQYFFFIWTEIFK